MPGLASAACSALESMDIENMVGTVAGDDTAFIAMRTASDAEKLYYRFREITL
jgi:transcriptional regulator of arginine metabolism